MLIKFYISHNVKNSKEETFLFFRLLEGIKLKFLMNPKFISLNILIDIITNKFCYVQ